MIATVGKEFAKSHAMLTMYAMRASVIYVPTCQRAKSVLTSHFYVPTCQRHANYSTWRANLPIFQLHLQKGVSVFQVFFKRIFQLCLTFANFKNVWAILENLS